MTAPAAVPAHRRRSVLGLLVAQAVVVALYLLALVDAVPLAVRLPFAEGLLAADALGCGLAVLAHARTADPATRTAWRFASGALLAWSGGQAWLAAERALTGTVVRPGVCDAFYVLGAVLAVGAALSFPTVATNRAGRLRALLDGVAVSGSVLLLTCLVVLRPGGDLPGLGLSLAYPLLEVGVAAVMVSAAVRLPRRHLRPLALALAGLLVLLLTNLVLYLQALSGPLPTPAPAEVGFLLAFGLVALGALLPGRLPGPRSSRGHRVQQLLPYVVVPPALGVLALNRDGLQGPTWLLAVALLGLFVLRQVLVVAENSTLAHELLRHAERNDELVALLHRETLTDELTGLANRRALLQDGRAATRPVALLYLDLDQFKRVNDSLGHAAGDALLRQVARTLEACTRPSDLVVRLGGDEFAVLLDDVADEATAVRVGQALLADLSVPRTVEGTLVWPGASVGVALSADLPEPGTARLLRHADAAMYAAKADGRGRVRAYRPLVDDAATDQLELERDLREALHDGSLQVHYQPVLRLHDGSCRGVEALARWSHPVRGPVAPEVFVGLAEETGLVVELGRQVLRRAVADAASWERDLGLPLTVAVNVSPRQLVEGDLVALVAAVLGETGLPPERLLLEVTERSLLAGDRAATVLRELAALGVRLALDDFGTGWSSIAHLREHPVDVLKLDRSYVGAMREDPRARALVLGLLDLAGHFRLSVTAEGVEDADVAAVLTAAGCGFAQGAHWSAALPEPALRTWLQEHVPTLVPEPRTPATR